MRKITFLITTAALLFSLNCGDDESSLDTGDCGAPTIDGTSQALDAGCRVADEEENVTIEGLTLESGDSLVMAMFADSISGTNGYLLTVTGEGTLSLVQGANSLASETGVDVTGQTICIDVHGEENPDHILIWLGDDCSGVADEEAAILNTEDESLTYTDATGTGFYYLVTNGSGNAAIDSITTEEPFFEEQ